MMIPTIDKIGGAERQVLLLANGLVARGYQVTIIALSGNGGELGIDVSACGICFMSLGMRKAWVDPRGWRRYLAWHRAHRPEIVHTHLPHATWFARWVRLIAPVPVVLDTIHTSKIGSLSRRAAYRLTAVLSDHVTCVSNSVAASVLAAGMSAEKNLSVLNNGVELLPIKPHGEELRYAGKFRWVAVGRLSAVKDYPTLLQAFAKLPANALLTIVGSGPDEVKLELQSETLGIAGRVLFAGFQNDVVPYLQQADALVLSSLWEGLPMTVLEAAAAGLPVVATDGAGTSEAIVEGETGFLAPVGDAVALADAMARLMALSADEQSEMGARGRQMVEERFALEVIVDQWERLYATLLAAHSRPMATRSRSASTHPPQP